MFKSRYAVAQYKTQSFLLRSIPYISTILVGVGLYLMSVYFIENDKLADLIFSIAGTLLAIPVVFLVYNYFDYRMSKKVNETLANSTIYEINSWMLLMIKVLRKILRVRDPFEWDSINRMLNTTQASIQRSLVIVKSDVPDLKVCKNEMDDLLYNTAQLSVLSPVQIQIMAALNKEISHLINEREYRGDKKKMAKYVYKIMDLMDDWFDHCEKKALLENEHYKLAVEQGDSAIDIK